MKYSFPYTLFSKMEVIQKDEPLFIMLKDKITGIEKYVDNPKMNNFFLMHKVIEAETKEEAEQKFIEWLCNEDLKLERQKEADIIYDKMCEQWNKIFTLPKEED